jgi:peptidyl-tRNA hydrolase
MKKLIVGLGNSVFGQGTRHGVGADLVHEIVTSLPLTWRFHPLVGGVHNFILQFRADWEKNNAPLLPEGWIADVDRTDFGGRVIFLWPLSPYNLCGFVVSQAASQFSVETKDVYVVHDDIDLKVGVIKKRHCLNGMKLCGSPFAISWDFN